MAYAQAAMATGGAGTRPLNVGEVGVASDAGTVSTASSASSAALNVPHATTTTALNVPMLAVLAAVPLRLLEWATGAGIASHLQQFAANAGEISQLTGVLVVCYETVHRYTKEQWEARLALLCDAASVPGALAREAEYAALHEPLRAARALVLAGCSTTSDASMPTVVEANEGPAVAPADVAELLRMSVDVVELAIPAVTAVVAGAEAMAAALHGAYEGLESAAITRRLQQLALLGTAATPPPTSRERAYAAHYAPLRALRQLIRQVLGAHAVNVAECTDTGASMLESATTCSDTSTWTALLAEEGRCAADAATEHARAAMRSLMGRVRDLTSASDVPVLRLDPATCDEPPPVFHALINIVVLGSGYAGKSCLVTRMCRSRWVQFSTAGAAGFDFLRLRVGGAKVGCVVADPLDGNRNEVTAIERAQAAHGAVLVYDATKRRTLAGVHRWLALLDEHASPLPPCIVVATFADKVTAVVSFQHCIAASCLGCAVDSQPSTRHDAAARRGMIVAACHHSHRCRCCYFRHCCCFHSRRS